MNRLLTAQEVSELLGVKTSWVYAEARSGRLPHVRIGRYRRFRPEAIAAWVEEAEAGGTTMRATTDGRHAGRR